MSGEPTETNDPMPELKPTIQYEDFAKLDLRVGTVLEAENHPNADRLLKLQVDLGPFGKRQLCAGIRGHVDPQEMVGRQIIVVANLASRKIRGEASNGMLMAASDEQSDPPAVVVLAPSRQVPAGSPVS